MKGGHQLFGNSSPVILPHSASSSVNWRCSPCPAHLSGRWGCSMVPASVIGSGATFGGSLALLGSPSSLSFDDSPAAVPAAGIEGPSGEARFSWAWAPPGAGGGAAQGCFSRGPGSREASAPPQEVGQRGARSGSECEFVRSRCRAEAEAPRALLPGGPRPSRRRPPPAALTDLCALSTGAARASCT